MSRTLTAMPTIVIHEGVPSAENIDRWRDWVLANCRGEAAFTVNAIFDCALVGAELAAGKTVEWNKMAADHLRRLAKEVGRKPE